jgi:hypothetical protein
LPTLVDLKVSSADTLWIPILHFIVFNNVFNFIINSNGLKPYFQKICMRIILKAKSRETAVFMVIPSSLKYHVNTAKDITPNVKVRNLLGYMSPLNASQHNLIACIKINVVGIAMTYTTQLLLSFNQSIFNIPYI